MSRQIDVGDGRPREPANLPIGSAVPDSFTDYKIGTTGQVMLPNSQQVYAAIIIGYGWLIEEDKSTDDSVIRVAVWAERYYAMPSLNTFVHYAGTHSTPTIGYR